MTIFNQNYQTHARDCLTKYTTFGQVPGNGLDPLKINLDAYMMQRLGRPFDGKIAMTGCHGAIGCGFWDRLFQGRSDEKQKKVGELIRRSDASLVFLLGDNFYDDGVKDSRDDRFVTAYRNVYMSTRSIEKQVIFSVLGNHDYKIHGFSAHGQKPVKALGGLLMTRNYTVGRSPRETIERGYRQVDYTYSQRNQCNVKGLNPVARPHPAWNMPYRYYLLYSELADFFCMDSSSYLFDTEQQQWLKEAYRSRAGVNNIKVLVQHHPIVSGGHRISSNNDLKMYASAFGVTNIDRHIHPFSSEHVDGGGGKLMELGWNIGYAMQRQGLDFKLILCAHDHVLTADKLATSREGHHPMVRLLNEEAAYFDIASLGTIVHANDRIDAHIPASTICTQLISGGGGASLSSDHDGDHAQTIAETQRGCNQRRYWEKHGYHYVEIAQDQPMHPPPQPDRNVSPSNFRAYVAERKRFQAETDRYNQLKGKHDRRKNISVTYYVRDENNMDIGGGAVG